MFLMMSALRDEAILQKLFHADARIADAAASRPSKAMARRIAADGMQAPAPGGPEGGPSPTAPLPLPAVPQRAAPRTPARPQQGAEARAFAEKHNVGRNEPCPCGSKRKFKKCCGSPQALRDAAQP
jgi:hypothetical protein